MDRRSCIRCNIKKTLKIFTTNKLNVKFVTVMEV